MVAQCWMLCGTGLCKMFKRSMLLRHRIEQCNIMPRHRTASLMNNAKKQPIAQKNLNPANHPADPYASKFMRNLPTIPFKVMTITS
jgi:hypothetical protein